MTRTIPLQESISVEFKSDVLDDSSLPVAGSTVADLDPLERERLRQLIERYGGDRPQCVSKISRGGFGRIIIPSSD